MIDGRTVVDAHMHVPRLSTVTPAWLQWAADFGRDSPWRSVFGADGDPVPARLEALLDAEGVDVALLFAEYSPRTTGIQPVEDLLPVIAHNPARFRLVANVNPELHPSPVTEATRQLNLGAVALKVHPVHGGFRPGTRDMYQVYDLCAERGVPVIVHTGGSIFPGSDPAAGDPALMGRAVADFPGVQFVLAHGGRGQWYADAARMALDCGNVWFDLAGLPPKRLPTYYAGFDLPRLAARWIFGTDWPGVPGVAANVRAVAALGLPDDVLADVLSGNAYRVYLGGQPLAAGRLTEQAPDVGEASGASVAARPAGPRGPPKAAGEQPLQQHDLVAVEIGRNGQLAEAFPGERERTLRGPELLPQHEVLLFQAADDSAQRRGVRLPRSGIGRREPPDQLDQQAAGQFIVIETSPVRIVSPIRRHHPGPCHPKSPKGPRRPRGQ